MSKRFAIIGAGAAGCLCAIEIKRRCPDAVIDLYEAGTRPLAKVAVTGGGRCNLTNDFEGIRSLSEAYPRGDKLMKRLFHHFNHEDAVRWFEKEGVRFVTQEDHCIFPVTQDAMTIVRTLTRLIDRLGIQLHLKHKVYGIERLMDQDQPAGFRLRFSSESLSPQECDVLVVTAGGFPRAGQYSLFDSLDLEIMEPVPSLFAFNIEDVAMKELAGAVVDPVTVGISGTKFKAEGPLLITDFGLSGPAILKLSSYAARHLHDQGYVCQVNINWLGTMDRDEVLSLLQSSSSESGMKLLTSVHPKGLSSRLWRLIVSRSGIPADLRWNALNKKHLNKLTETLVNDPVQISGKNKFKEEFVTCGGVSLSNLNLNTLEARNCPGLYFAGEIMDVDAITGGFNLQAAWTTGYVVAEHCVR